MRFCSQCGAVVEGSEACPSCRQLGAPGLSPGDSESTLPPELPIPTSRSGQTASTNDYLDGIIHIAGFALKVGTALVCAAVAVIVLLCTLTVVGFLTGNVSIICAAGLAWVLMLLETVVLVDSLKDIAHWIARNTQRLSNRLDALSIEIGQQDLFRLATWLLNGTARFSKQLGNTLFLLMGLVAALARTLTEIHLVIGRQHTLLAGSIGVPWFLSVGFTFLPPILGAFADRNKRVHFSPGNAGTAVAFLTTLEFSRCLLQLTTGLWGPSAFDAADKILSLPSRDSLFGIPLMLPVWILSEERREAAFTLYQTQGFYIYTLFFGLFPLAVFVNTLWAATKRLFRNIKRLFKDDPVKEETILQRNTAARFVFSCGLLLLTSTVAYRTGGLGRYMIVAQSYFQSTATDKILGSCLLASKSYVTDETCIQEWRAKWEAELAVVYDQVTRALPSNQRSQFKQREDAWRRTEVPSMSAASPNDDLSARIAQLYFLGRQIRDRVQELRAQSASLKR